MGCWTLHNLIWKHIWCYWWLLWLSQSRKLTYFVRKTSYNLSVWLSYQSYHISTARWSKNTALLICSPAPGDQWLKLPWVHLITSWCPSQVMPTRVKYDVPVCIIFFPFPDMTRKMLMFGHELFILLIIIIILTCE